ncbi:hypothetical protein D7X33_31135 [Butyricicoccus sp. 1XD8-22]|nr:hypothetical protein D7X33_31135 [Butyricicoccus sp. 1XD8-22]
MKPSAYKKIKDFKKKLSKLYYKVVYPLAWIIDKSENFSREILKKKATPEYVSKLIAKDIYKKMSRRGIKRDEVIIAEWVDTESGYNSAWSIIDHYLRYGSKSRKAYYLLKGITKNELIELVMDEFESLNKYTYVDSYIDEELMKSTWYVRNYIKTIEFGIRE